MAPNSEEGARLAALPWEEDSFTKEKQRPPVYNPEDYAQSLRKWTRKPINGAPTLYVTASSTEMESPRSQGTSFRDYRNPMLTPAESEMTLRQFGTISELLSKLKSDLRLAYPSFVQEFVADPHDGISLLLEILRIIQLSQANHTNITATANGNGKVPPSLHRRALLDELSCLQCLLCCCLRYSESVHRLTGSSAGLYALTVCIMSNVNKSRIIALQLLAKACEFTENGHSAVSEAMSTLRLRFGEPVRFRFLIGMLTSAGGQGELLVSGMKFVNTFLDTSSSTQRRLYIQAELEQAGFDIINIKNNISINSPSAEALFEEFDHWEKHHIDVDTLTIRAEDAERENDTLRDKVLLLERRIQILQEEKGILLSLEQCLKERCSELQGEVSSLKSEKSPKITCKPKYKKQGDSTPAEDEGISSSERSLTPDDIQQEQSVYEVFSLQSETIPMKMKSQKFPISAHKLLDDDEEETTIEEVMEELKNIINDAETQEYAAEKRLEAKKQDKNTLRVRDNNIANKIQMRVDSIVINDPLFNDESEIIPANLHPQPPRRTRSLVHLFIPTEDYDYNKKTMFFENETPYTSDESSDSLLSASKCQLPKNEKEATPNNNNNRAILNSIMDARDRLVVVEAQKQKESATIRNSIKRSESFRQLMGGAKGIQTTENTRHNSFDGIFVVTGISQAPTATPTFKRLRRMHKNSETASSKVKSKSLDRIDNGLDTMVDIVMTNQNMATDQGFLRIRPQSDSGNVTGTTLSRSTSNIFLHNKTDVKISRFPSSNQSRFEEKPKIFLPHHRYDRPETDMRYYFPRIQQEKRTNNNSFLLKRGYANAGLYSGFCTARDKLSDSSTIQNKTDIAVRNRSNFSTSEKVTDLPSGLY